MNTRTPAYFQKTLSFIYSMDMEALYHFVSRDFALPLLEMHLELCLGPNSLDGM